MRTLFVKQSIDPFGPWSPVTWATESSDSILRKFLYKVTLWEMTCVLGADWRIIRSNAATPFSDYVARLPRLSALLASQQTDVLDAGDIEFDQYDLVISLEPCIPASVIERHPRTAFVYFLNEHSNDTYRQHLAAPAPGYRRFLDHMCGDVSPAGRRFTGHPLRTPYLRAPEVIRALAREGTTDAAASRHARPRVWIDARSVLVAATGDPYAVWTSRCDTFVDELARRYDVDVRCRSTIYRDYYHVADPQSNDAEAYVLDLASVDYFVSLCAAGAGQSLCDAASLGIPCVGTKALVYHRLICAPAATTTSLDQAMATVRRWQEHPARRAAVREHQDARLARVMRKDPLSALSAA